MQAISLSFYSLIEAVQGQLGIESDVHHAQSLNSPAGIYPCARRHRSATFEGKWCWCVSDVCANGPGCSSLHEAATQRKSFKYIRVSIHYIHADCVLLSDVILTIFP